jgi:PAS domain S-box-containing protein
MTDKNLLRILFIEDLPSDVDLAVLELRKEKLKFEHTTVCTRGDLLKAYKKFKPNLIISDYMMPTYNGLQALRDVKEIDESIPFILFTGTVNEETAVECLKAGATDYVLKEHLIRLPFAVKEALEQNRIQIEKRAADLLLKENEEKLQSIFRAASVGIGLVINRIFIEVNDTFCKMTGYNRKELIGKSAEMIYSTNEEYDRVGIEKYRQIAEKGTGSVETCFKRKDGSILNIFLTSTPLDIDDMTKGVTFTVMDITERKRAEEALVESETKYRQLVTQSPDGIFIIDLSGKFLSVNRIICDNLKYTEEELLSMKMWDIVPEQYHSQHKQRLLALMNGESTNVEAEYKVKGKDGTVHFIEVLSVPYYDGKKIVGFQGIARDINERKKAEESLRESEEKYRRVFENVMDLYYETSIEGTILEVSPSIEFLSKGQYHRDDLIGKSIYDFYSDPNERATLISQLKKQGNVSDFEITLKNKDGSQIPCSISSKICLDARAHPEKIIGSMRNITDRLQAQKELLKYRDHLEELVNKRTEELNYAKKEADDANKAKSEFLANMSHEIRTPMNAVLGYSELLSSTLVDQTQKDYINSIKSSGKSLLTLINDILDLSKIEAGKLELEYDYVDVHSFFSEFERIFSLKVTEKNLKFILNITSGTPQGVYIDEVRVRQILFNLIGNAIKFTSEGNVTLKVFTENPQIVNLSKEKSEELIDLIIEVQDTGIGISKELQEAIFEPFVQVRDFNNYGGTGLGLTITRRLTALMGGSIHVKSKPDKGSTFTVRIPEIPYLRDFSKTNVDIQIDPSEIIFEKATILIADDVQHNRSYLSDALKNTRLKIAEAEDGIAAYKLAKKIVPDLIIADIRMPKMDGFQLLDKIKSDEKLKHIPVIAYSASVLKAQKERIHNSEFAGLLIKPVKVTELYLELMNLLPFKSTGKAKPDQPLSEVDLIGEMTNLPVLIHSLETSFYTTWKTFAVRQPIGEIRDFGKNLIQLGLDHNSSIISGYGKELILAADSFNIEALLKLIGKYTVIIKSFKDSAKNPNND